jgi:hypothetical protein
MIKTITLVAGLAIVPAAVFAQSTQAPVNSPSNNRPTTAAPTPTPGDSTRPATAPSGVAKDPAGSGVTGATTNPPANPGGVAPAQPAPSGTPNPASGGASSTKP